MNPNTDASFELSPIGRAIWEDRYALKDDDGNPLETSILETFARTAKAMAGSDDKSAEEFYDIMAEKKFCPAGRILANAGTPFSQLLNCYVLPFEDDSLESIMKTAHDMAVTQKFGGGTGFSYSNLRPEGSHIKGVNGRSCGSVGFIDMMSVISGVIEQGGSRRGANLGLLEIWHPDIWKFVQYKNDNEWDKLREFMEVKDEERWEYFKKANPHKLQMYNISVGITEEFLEALHEDDYWSFKWGDDVWDLYTVLYKKDIGEGAFKEKSFEVVANGENTAVWKVRRSVPYPKSSDVFEVTSKRRLKAREIWEKLCYNAWANGCPGLLNMTTIRKMHNGEYVNPINATNPCGEQPLPAYGACNLGSIILSSFVEDGQINFVDLKKTVDIAVRFLDNVTDHCEFPIPEQQEVALNERRIGLGTMGIHDMLIKLGLAYDSEAGRNKAAQVLEIIRDTAYNASIQIAMDKGSFPSFKADEYLQSNFVQGLPEEIREGIKNWGMRNMCVLSQAPTGTIGTMLSVSQGCEPWFAMSFDRHTNMGTYLDGCQDYIDWREKNPDEEKPDYFKSAMEIDPEDHLKMMILFSKYIDSAVSKTINLPNSATVEDVSAVFLKALENGVKGITIFRDGSRMGVLESKDKEKEDEPQEEDQDTFECVEEVMDERSHFRKRGNRVVGATTRIHMDNRNLYVTVNKNGEGDMVEVFATVGESKKPNTHHTSGVEDSWAEALGKVVSLALRAGVRPESIIRNLKNIPSDKPVFETVGDSGGSELLPSPSHAIARVMEEELQYIQNNIKIEKENRTGGACTNCGSAEIRWKTSTCYDCLSCGYSGCG